MAETHANARLEAFCDAVFAIAMTLLMADVQHQDETRLTPAL